jgi:hypothetical protein
MEVPDQLGFARPPQMARGKKKSGYRPRVDNFMSDDWFIVFRIDDQERVFCPVIGQLERLTSSASEHC